jgi:cyclophilin family peptidyl-prolyl cis-trans isomerase
VRNLYVKTEKDPSLKKNCITGFFTVRDDKFFIFRLKKINKQNNKGEKFMPKNPIAIIKTNMGTMKLELFEDIAPLTAGNFISLAEKGFYDGIIFHRIIKNFMIQGGCPKGLGIGGPGYKIKDEFAPGLTHDKKGILSMANAGPDTGGSQFFITLVPCKYLDGKHAIFGKIIDGEDVLTAIGNVKTGYQDRPVEDVVMEKVTIERK